MHARLVWCNLEIHNCNFYIFGILILCLVLADAVTAGFEQCGAVLAETNRVGVEDGVMDPAVRYSTTILRAQQAYDCFCVFYFRHVLLAKLGFKKVDWPYTQPPLSPDQGPCKYVTCNHQPDACV